MKILSLNLHCFKEENRISKLNKIIEYIKVNEIDVCIFQEVAQTKNEKIIYDNIRTDNNAFYISNSLNYNIIFHPIKIGFSILEEGLAIISNKKISNPYYDTISKTTDYNVWHKRDYLSASIENIRFFNTHIGWDEYGEIGLDQIKKLLVATEKYDNLVMLCGDFNYNDLSAEIKYIKKFFWSASDLFNLDSNNNPTFHYELDNKNSNNTNKMIDFIFINKKISIKNFEIIFNKDLVSDHYGLLLEI